MGRRAIVSAVPAVSAILVVLLQGVVVAATTTLTEDRMALVDGKRTFILGLYENPADDAVLADVARAGFNLVNAPPDPAALDRLRQHGLHGWVNTGEAIDLSVDRAGREQALRDLVAKLSAHPAMLVWEVPDEALWNTWYSAITWRRDEEPSRQAAAIAALSDKALAERLNALRQEASRKHGEGDYAEMERIQDSIWKELGQTPPNPDLNLSNAATRAATRCAGISEGYRLLRGLDAAHPVWMNHAPRNSIEQLAAFNAGADIVGCDIYPVPAYRGGHSDLADRSLVSVGAYTERMQQAAPGKAVWMVLQGFGWADITAYGEADKPIFRRPTYAESRFMAYDAIMRGARGLLYWGTAYVEKDSPLWADLLRLARELADLQPVLSAPDAPDAPSVRYAETWGSVDRGIRALPKLVDGQVWFVVVNEWSDCLEYTLGPIKAPDGARFADTQSGAEVVVSSGTLTARIPPYGVQVLAPKP